MHQSMARGDGAKAPSGDCYGCESFASMNEGHHNPDNGMDTGRTLHDCGRAGPPTLSRGGGKLGAQAHSDHGPHNLHSDLHAGSAPMGNHIPR